MVTVMHTANVLDAQTLGKLLQLQVIKNITTLYYTEISEIWLFLSIFAKLNSSLPFLFVIFAIFAIFANLAF